MKLYATTSDSLDKYIGKDIWVKVKISIFHIQYYIHIVKVEDGIVYYNMCNAYAADYQPESTYEDFNPFEVLETSIPRRAYLDQVLNHVCHTPKADIHIQHPVDLLSTKEIIAGIEANVSE